MKKALIASSILLAGAANADVLGLTAEIGQYSPDATFNGSVNGNSSNSDLSGESNTYFGVAFEHPVPVIPNIRLQGSTLEGSSNDAYAKIDSTDYTLYYEILDGLAWIDLDVGVSFRQMDVEATSNGSSASESLILPTGYVSAYFTIPTLPISVGGELKTLAIGDSSVTDTTIKVKYQSPFIVGVEGGYRNANLTIDEGDLNTEVDFDGLYIGVFADF